MTEQNIYSFILKNFPREIVEVDMVKSLLITKPIILLPKEKTTGNHMVYSVNIEGDISVDEKEYSILFICAGAGIAEHIHAKEDAISEVYFALGKRYFSWKGKHYSRYSNLVGSSHGVDIEDANRIILTEKTSEFKKYYNEAAFNASINKFVKSNSSYMNSVSLKK